MGTPCEKISVASMLRIFFARSSRISGLSVGPSTPQFQLMLSLAPSRLFSPLLVVVLLIVGDQIVQREAVVTGDEVDAGVRPAAAPLVQIARAGEARGELGDHAAVPLPEVADRSRGICRSTRDHKVGKLPTW